MNERIKVLAEQAGWKFALPVTGEYSGYDKVVDKFAELIINECVNYLRTTDFSEVVGSQNVVAETAAMDLLNLFGIGDE